MNKVNISLITSTALRNGDFAKDLPEYYALKDKKENSSWHTTEPTIFDHCVRVYEQLESILDLHIVSPNSQVHLSKQLSSSLERYSRLELLKVATILHDIAKGVTWIQKPDGSTSCPGHEVVGSAMVKSYQDRFGLSDSELSVVRDIVLFHGIVHEFSSQAVKDSTHDQRFYDLLKEVIGPSFMETMLLVYADVLGSDVNLSDPEEFRKRPLQLIKWLERFSK